MERLTKNGSCIACSSEAGAVVSIDETMFRTGEQFDYTLCHTCKSIQINQIPSDLHRHYGGGYYSFELGARRTRQWLRWPLAQKLLRLNTAIYNNLGIGKGVSWARKVNIETNDRILDFGCGAGDNLMLMHVLGYSHLEGADPFLAEDTQLPGGVYLRKRSHGEVVGEFDWIMLHHVFEHVADPIDMIHSLARSLSSHGRFLVRMPVMDSYAWRCYRENWAQLDAPRHLAIYSEKGFRTLLAREGFDVELCIYDSTSFQFWGSEMARNGIPHSGSPRAHFTSAAIQRWDRWATQLNGQRDGDQALYVLKPRRNSGSAITRNSASTPDRQVN